MIDPHPILYCHGLPGSVEEVDWACPGSDRKRLLVLDRTAHWCDGPGWSMRVLAGFDELATQPCRLVGFSLGAMAALHIAANRPEAVSSLELISPAAPLELGRFLPDMAGRPVFEAAIAGRFRLSLLTAAQRAIFFCAPGTLSSLLFAGAPRSERDLLRAADFTRVLQQGLRLCLTERRAAYTDELLTYVQPWAPVLDRVSCPVRLWHGTEDNWTPRAMANALAARLDHAEIESLKSMGHFGTLRTALQAILLGGDPAMTEHCAPAMGGIRQ